MDNFIAQVGEKKDRACRFVLTPHDQLWHLQYRKVAKHETTDLGRLANAELENKIRVADMFSAVWSSVDVAKQLLVD